MRPTACVRTEVDILPAYRDTPVGDLLRYHNLGAPHRAYAAARLLVGMCMDHRNMLRIPDNFAYVLRTGGANLQRVEFKVSYVIAVGGIRAVCLIGHDQCGMVGLRARRDTFVAGLVEHAGWDAREAAEHFDQWASAFEIGDAAEFVRTEAARLRARYRGLLVAPLLYDIAGGKLQQVLEPAASV